MQATGARLNSRGSPTLASLSRGSQKSGQVSRHGEPPCSRWEFSQKRREREKTTGGKPVFPGTGPFFIFQVHLYIFCYTQRQNTKSRGVSRPDLYQNQVLHINVYKRSQGALHHLLARGPANILWPFLSDNGQSIRKLILPGVNFLKPGATLQRYQIKLHSYRVKVQWVTLEKGIYLA